MQAHAGAGMAASFRAGGLLRFTAPIVVTQARPDGTHEDKLVGHVLLGLTSTKLNQRLGEVRLLVLGLLGAGGLAAGRAGLPLHRAPGAWPRSTR